MTATPESNSKSLIDPTIAIGGFVIAAITFMMTYTPSDLATKLMPWRLQMTVLGAVAFIVGIFWLGFWIGKRSAKPVEVVREVEVTLIKEVDVSATGTAASNSKMRPINDLIYGANEVVTQVTVEADLSEQRVKKLLQRIEFEHVAWHEDGPRLARNDFVALVKHALQQRLSSPRHMYGTPPRYAPLDHDLAHRLDTARDKLIAELHELQAKRDTISASVGGRIDYGTNGYA